LTNGHLIPRGEELLFKCFGLDYMATVSLVHTSLGFGKAHGLDDFFQIIVHLIELIPVYQ
jgi:hypothetical protein